MQGVQPYLTLPSVLNEGRFESSSKTYRHGFGDKELEETEKDRDERRTVSFARQVRET